MATTSKKRKPVKVKIAPERIPVERVYNISDWPATSVPATTVMVMGVAVSPGQCIEVPKERLKGAKKTYADKERGLLAIGELPEAYKQWREAVKAQKPHGASPGHGRPPVKAGDDKGKAFAEFHESATQENLARAQAMVSSGGLKLDSKKVSSVATHEVTKKPDALDPQVFMKKEEIKTLELPAEDIKLEPAMGKKPKK